MGGQKLIICVKNIKMIPTDMFGGALVDDESAERKIDKNNLPEHLNDFKVDKIYVNSITGCEEIKKLDEQVKLLNDKLEIEKLKMNIETKNFNRLRPLYYNLRKNYDSRPLPLKIKRVAGTLSKKNTFIGPYMAM